jgi:N-methylhydantoinase B
MSGERLRDLGEAEFAARYGSDRFTMSVLANRMRFIVEHMCGNLLNNAFSQILRDWYDFAATISGAPDADYPMAAVSNSLAVFFGTMADGLRNAAEEYGPDQFQPGDVLICNDPYRTGTHVNDVLLTRPVFYQGELLAFVSLRAHQLDMGGPVPAGFSATKRNVYETGLVISPQLLYSQDRPVRAAFNLILDNARYGALLLPDLRTIYQNLRLGERLLTETLDRYGPAALRSAIRYSCDVSADSMTAAIGALPDGTYHGETLIDADGVDASREYTVQVTVRKAGPRVEVDLSGSSPQARTSINASVLDTKTAVGIGLKYLLDPDSPFTSGTYRPIDIVLPAGTIASATPPDGAVFLYWEGANPVLAALLKALAGAVGENAMGGDFGSTTIHSGNGVHPDGTPWVTAAQVGGEHGPWSATRHGDADSYAVNYQGNNLDPATEALESDTPVVLLRKEYVTDSAGAGYHRGGAAVLKDSLWLTEAEHWSSPLQTKRPPGFGVRGGGSGKPGAVWLFEDAGTDLGLLPVDDTVYARSMPVAGLLSPETKARDEHGQYYYFASNPIWRTGPGAIFRYITAGGGGWGNPLEREPDRVREDVRDGYLSIAAAERDYGVVVTGDPDNDPEGLRIDEARTAALREQGHS